MILMLPWRITHKGLLDNHRNGLNAVLTQFEFPNRKYLFLSPTGALEILTGSKLIQTKKFEYFLSPETFIHPYGVMPWWHRDLHNWNLEYFGTKVSDLKMAITLVFLDLFKSFKRLKWSAWKGLSICEVCSVMKISRKQPSLWKESKSGGRNEQKWKFDFKQL